ncbi:MAG: hypothetical protein ACP5VR_07540 [Acidimicrobiales bacterium]
MLRGDQPDLLPDVTLSGYRFWMLATYKRLRKRLYKRLSLRGVPGSLLS